MVSAHPFEKRIKRHVIGPTHEFFVAVSPGLESVCADELTQPPLDLADIRETGGGVVFHGRLTECYKANLYLKTANRILMRVALFSATGFARLEQKIADVPWELYLDPGRPVALRVTCRRSRLYHSGAVRQRFETGIRVRLEKCFPNPTTPPAGAAQAVFVRAVADRFTVSIDSSGELLHRRGLKTHHGRAPIRETHAAAVLTLAGYSASEPLIDPMCGSGTFSLEAAMRICRMPAGWRRDFAFTGWPAFRPAQWRYLKSKAADEMRVSHTPSVFALDTDRETIRRLRGCVTAHGLDQTVQAATGDFFDLVPRRLGRLPGLVVLNPPYGRRLGRAESAADRYAAICDKLIADFRGWRFALIAPPSVVPRSFHSAVVTRRLLHGGLRLELHLGRLS